MMEAKRLSFDAAEKRRRVFASKRRSQIENMSKADGMKLMLAVRKRIITNSRTREVTTDGQQADALAFWEREWAEYSNDLWHIPPQASSCVSTTSNFESESLSSQNENKDVAATHEISPILRTAERTDRSRMLPSDDEEEEKEEACKKGQWAGDALQLLGILGDLPTLHPMLRF